MDIISNIFLTQTNLYNCHRRHRNNKKTSRIRETEKNTSVMYTQPSTKNYLIKKYLEMHQIGESNHSSYVWNDYYYYLKCNRIVKIYIFQTTGAQNQ